jgi:hypothetical protein
MSLIEEYEKLPVVELVKEMSKVKAQLDEVKAQKTDLQKLYDLLRLRLLPERMDAEDVSTLTVDGAGRVSLQSDLYFSIPADRREEAYKWLRENGAGDIIRPTVNAGTGKAWAKEMLLNGKQLPEGLFKVTPYTRAIITKR